MTEESEGRPYFTHDAPGEWIDSGSGLRCPTCGVEVQRDQRDRARLHWEEHVFAQSGKTIRPGANVRWLTIDPHSPGKDLASGPLSDLLVHAMGRLLDSGRPFPTRSVVSELINLGEIGAGMEVRLEWPRYRISSASYEEAYESLLASGYTSAGVDEEWVSTIFMRRAALIASRREFEIHDVVRRTAVRQELAHVLSRFPALPNDVREHLRLRMEEERLGGRRIDE